MGLLAASFRIDISIQQTLSRVCNNLCFYFPGGVYHEILKMYSLSLSSWYCEMHRFTLLHMSFSFPLLPLGEADFSFNNKIFFTNKIHAIQKNSLKCVMYLFKACLPGYSLIFLYIDQKNFFIYSLIQLITFFYVL